MGAHQQAPSTRLKRIRIHSAPCSYPMSPISPHFSMQPHFSMHPHFPPLSLMFPQTKSPIVPKLSDISNTSLIRLRKWDILGLAAGAPGGPWTPYHTPYHTVPYHTPVPQATHGEEEAGCLDNHCLCAKGMGLWMRDSPSLPQDLCGSNGDLLLWMGHLQRWRRSPALDCVRSRRMCGI